ncbi:clathrin heavy chain linker domain-containing protein 1-like [Dendronephthya gigantea]|uniref:clathrin heavy chain linker domain-containing protein 1-like n=1 Tax=Dendronephthya gigantea TaxID=151771 RepID=UPI00106AABC6|nr:clathrin heavy chain linker domain-containing protein 1-like [Dendronephthya gigantea]
MSLEDNSNSYVDEEELGWHINAENHADFASKLTKKLEKRLEEHEQCHRKTRKERHAIISQCFEEVIRNNGCFGPLLSEIKVEYEKCIRAVFQSERDADFLHRNMTSCAAGLGTIKNYKEQISDLEKKSRMLLEQNEILRQKSRTEIEPVRPKSEIVLEQIQESIAAIRGESFHRKTPWVRAKKFGNSHVKVLERYTSDEQTDLEFLNDELRRLRREIMELVKFFDKRFKLRKTKDKLIEKLMEKEQMKIDLKEHGNALKTKLLRLEERLKEERKQRDLVMAKKPKTIAELILLALKHGETEDDFIDSIEEELTASESSEEEDNAGEQEQEEMVEYMDKFEQLFTSGCYEEAATVAATSPQDILRTAQTFERFKEEPTQPGETSPLLNYCEAVIANSSNPGQKGLNAAESMDAVIRAFEENRRDLVVHWLSQEKLKHSDMLGDSIVAFCSCGQQVCHCGWHTLAEMVYRHTKAHGKVVACLCRQGRLNMAVDHARKVAKFRRTDFMHTLEQYPSFAHAQVLLLVGDGYLSSPLCREECIASLVRACRPRDAARLLSSAHDRIQCAKIVPYVCAEQEEAWVEFHDVLVGQGFATAAWDVVSAWILADVFSTAMFKIGL